MSAQPDLKQGVPTHSQEAIHPIPSGQAVSLRIAFIGGGGRLWAPAFMNDLALCPDLTGEVVLHDLDLDAAQANVDFAAWLQEQPGVLSRWRYRAEGDLAAALRGADVVVISIQPGSLAAMRDEIAIAEEYGLFYPVGDTAGATGLVRALRSATIYIDLARAIAEHCPKAWVINYTNPMTVCTRTLTAVAPELNVIGCCHEVHSTRRMLAELVGKYWGVDPTPDLHEIDVNVYGVNHFTWVDRATWQGKDLLALLRHHIAEPGVIREYTQTEVEAFGSWFHSTEQVKFALFQRYGVLGAAGDRHLVEFLPGFIRSPETLFRWGVIRTPVSWRMSRLGDVLAKRAAIVEGREPFVLESTGEEGVAIMRALVGLGDITTNANMENRGQIPNLPDRAVVETNVHFANGAITPVNAGALPQTIHPLIARHVANQEMIVQAALTKDRDLAFAAIYNDPSHSLPIDEAWTMFNRMLLPSLPWLPGWTPA